MDFDFNIILSRRGFFKIKKKHLFYWETLYISPRLIIEFFVFLPGYDEEDEDVVISLTSGMHKKREH